VPFLPSSPRKRRRLTWLAAALAAAGGIAGIVVLVPNPAQPNPNPPKNAPPAQLARPVSTHVSAANRRAIDATLDRFVLAGLDRHSMTTAWRLSGPQLKGGSTLREWKAGTSPIPYYPARGTTFHGWTTIDAGPKYVVFNLLVHPRDGHRTSAYVFSGEVIKRGSHWLVNRWYTIATMERPTKSGRHEVGPADFMAGSAPQAAAPAKARLGSTWLLAGGGIAILAILFPAAFVTFSVLRSRRRRRDYARAQDRVLPPLPTREREPVGGPRG
jgi:hypothetical protein